MYLRASEASASCGAETGAMGSCALVGTGHAAEVLGAAHGLEVTAYEQQLHLGKGQGGDSQPRTRAEAPCLDVAPLFGFSDGCVNSVQLSVAAALDSDPHI